jgi:hypothetical protein
MKRSLSSLAFWLSISISSCAPDVPPATESLALKSEIEDYLATSIIRPGFGGKIFAAVDVLGQHLTRDTLTAYVWAVIQEYYTADTISEGTGIGLPVAVYFYRGDGTAPPKLDHHDAPRDGSLYAKDIETIFPPDIQRRLSGENSGEHAARITRLNEELLRKREAYF